MAVCCQRSLGEPVPGRRLLPAKCAGLCKRSPCSTGIIICCCTRSVCLRTGLLAMSTFRKERLTRSSADLARRSKYLGPLPLTCLRKSCWGRVRTDSSGWGWAMGVPVPRWGVRVAAYELYILTERKGRNSVCVKRVVGSRQGCWGCSSLRVCWGGRRCPPRSLDHKAAW